MPTRPITAVQYSFTNLDKRLSLDTYVLVRKLNKVVTSTLELAKFVALRLHNLNYWCVYLHHLQSPTGFPLAVNMKNRTVCYLLQPSH